jgi:2-oxoglutarate ferredoxin oxidoreductase subunit beta
VTEATLPLAPKKLTKKDMVSDQEVRWCPGCGDYAILSAIQRVMPELGIPRENMAFISGIGCSSRFPYYMNTYGFHTIHGRAPAFATGLKCANPDLSVWMITGDGDGLSIGGNHLLHVLRRNPDINILLFNNRIYGLTKGQYSPTSELGKVTKSTPYGSIDAPINPLKFAIASGATFVARTYDSDIKHMGATFRAAAAHNGVSFIEILQNCPIFNDGTWRNEIAKKVRTERLLYLEDKKPMVYGKAKNMGVKLKGFGFETVEFEGDPPADLITHDISLRSTSFAYLMTELESPLPVGIFRQVDGGPSYETALFDQLDYAREKHGHNDLDKLYRAGASTWMVDSSP